MYNTYIDYIEVDMNQIFSLFFLLLFIEGVSRFADNTLDSATRCLQINNAVSTSRLFLNVNVAVVDEPSGAIECIINIFVFRLEL